MAMELQTCKVWGWEGGQWTYHGSLLLINLISHRPQCLSPPHWDFAGVGDAGEPCGSPEEEAEAEDELVL